jgi:hypothetical protein
MSVITSAPSRISQRVSAARTRRRSISNDQWYLTHGRTSLGETFAVGLGCDTWRSHPLLNSRHGG